jgi:hypothetical protein
MIARLFAIEADIKGKLPAECVAARPGQETPIPAELRAFLEETIAKVRGKSGLAGAIRYAASRWTALTYYVDDGRLERSNNAAECAIRPSALGRRTISSQVQTTAIPDPYVRLSRWRRHVQARGRLARDFSSVPLGDEIQC